MMENEMYFHTCMQSALHKNSFSSKNACILISVDVLVKLNNNLLVFSLVSYDIDVYSDIKDII